MLDTRTDLGLVRVLGILHREHVNRVRGHLLLRDQNLLGPVDDEVTAGVQRALAQLAQVTVGEAVEEAVSRTKHDGNFADERLVVLRLAGFFAFDDDGLRYVDVQRGCVREVSKTCHVRHHRARRSVTFPVDRLG